MPRTIQSYEGTSPLGVPRTVKVRWCPDFEEYVCEVTDNGIRRPAIDYFTNARDDALATAAVMAGAKQ